MLSGLLFTTLRLEHALHRRWRAPQEVSRAYWSRNEVAAAVWADACKELVGARRAKRAFEGADAGVGAGGRKVSIAAFAVGAQFEHWGLPGGTLATAVPSFY